MFHTLPHKLPSRPANGFQPGSLGDRFSAVVEQVKSRHPDRYNLPPAPQTTRQQIEADLERAEAEIKSIRIPDGWSFADTRSEWERGWHATLSVTTLRDRIKFLREQLEAA